MTVDDPIVKDIAPGTLTYGLILQGPELTVCSEAPAAPVAEGAYQSEADLEAGLIDILTHQGYDRLYVETEAELVRIIDGRESSRPAGARPTEKGR